MAQCFQLVYYGKFSLSDINLMLVFERKIFYKILLTEIANAEKEIEKARQK